MSPRALTLGLLLAGILSFPASADSWIVDPGGGGDFITIQAAIAVAHEGDEILVHPATYPENIDFQGKDLYLHSTAGPAATIIDGSSGPPGYASCVRFRSGETVDAVLEGFTLTGGQGSIYRGRLEDGFDDVLAGGGVYCSNASPTVQGCMIVDNTAEYAAGMLIASGNPRVLECDFEFNAAGSYGGGVAGPNAAPLIQDCIFEGNSAGYGAAAVHLLEAGRIERCVFRENRAYIAAAVNASQAGADLQIVECIFVGNVAWGSDGAAVRIHEASASVSRCLFVGNSAAQTGGGVFVLDGGHADVSQCTFYGNAAVLGGNLAARESAVLTVTHCIIAHAGSGGGLYCASSTVHASCDDAWSNAGGNYVGCPDPTGSNGNIGQDPLLCDPESGDFQLASDSPCASENNPECGQIGLYPVGCGATPVAETSWGALKSMFRGASR
jgi:hypothetical protein